MKDFRKEREESLQTKPMNLSSLWTKRVKILQKSWQIEGPENELHKRDCMTLK
ncbi:hypothetical protein DPMN_095607 [Dreissena polymorpha]|uniref:Uncharacterized protein n=1 Tax=Dreissena polymorpha TaxID=45954 RepID=A0A9D4L897_DREPO|nr:hypothetical protein DPMN_095607 [Dreissena polymorpha]